VAVTPAANADAGCVRHKQSLVEAAGFEPCCDRNTNLMMACDFGRCAVHFRRLADRRIRPT